MTNQNPSLKAARAWLSPFLFLLTFLLLATSGHAGKNRSLLVAPPGTTPQEDAFPRIVDQAKETSTAREAGFKLVVRYPTELNEHVQPAITALRRPVVFLRDATGLQSGGQIETYLYPLAPGEDPPHYQPRGRAKFTGVFFVPAEGELFDVEKNRGWYLQLLPHELVHTYLSSLPIADRWLEDGLAEYLKRAFVNTVTGELSEPPTSSATLADWNPAIVALRRVEWEPWSDRKTTRVLKLRRKDPALAAYLGQQEIWNYAAAAELLERWMEAAAKKGIEAPVRDLVQRMQDRKGRTRWQDTRELIQTQTGQSVEELTQVTPEDIGKARQWAWSERLSPHFPTRLRALRTLTFLGPPEGADFSTLLSAFDLPDIVPPGPYVEQTLAIAASGAVAATEDKQAATAAADLLRKRHDQAAHRYAYPALWVAVAAVDRDRALEALANTVNDPLVGLNYREQANESLEALTGSATGWSAELSPTERQEAASQWVKLLSKRSADQTTEKSGA